MAELINIFLVESQVQRKTTGEFSGHTTMLAKLDDEGFIYLQIFRFFHPFHSFFPRNSSKNWEPKISEVSEKCTKFQLFGGLK